MTDDSKKPRSLEDLDARLRAARAREEPGAPKGDAPGGGAGMGLGFRIAVELVAGVAVGTLIGYGLDGWLGTRPWLMVVFLFLGAAAGTMNVYRAAKGLDESVGIGRGAKAAGTESDERIMKRGQSVANPVEQFKIQPLVPIEVGGVNISFTNSVAFHVGVGRPGHRVPDPLGARPRPGSRPLAIDGRDVLRIRRQHDPRQCRDRKGGNISRSSSPCSCSCCSAICSA